MVFPGEVKLRGWGKIISVRGGKYDRRPWEKTRMDLGGKWIDAFEGQDTWEEKQKIKPERQTAENLDWQVRYLRKERENRSLLNCACVAPALCIFFVYVILSSNLWSRKGDILWILYIKENRDDLAKALLWVWVEQKLQSRSICLQGPYSFRYPSPSSTEGNGEPSKRSDQENRVTYKDIVRIKEDK